VDKHIYISMEDENIQNITAEKQKRTAKRRIDRKGCI
jgi:hypothetical protein